MYLFALYFGVAKQNITQNDMIEYIEKLRKVPDDVEQLLKVEQKNERIGKTVCPFKRCFCNR